MKFNRVETRQELIGKVKSLQNEELVMAFASLSEKELVSMTDEEHNKWSVAHDEIIYRMVDGDDSEQLLDTFAYLNLDDVFSITGKIHERWSAYFNEIMCRMVTL